MGRPLHDAEIATMLLIATDTSMTAMALAVGCPPDRLDDFWRHLRTYPMTHSPAGIYAIFTDALATLPPKDCPKDPT